MIFALRARPPCTKTAALFAGTKGVLVLIYAKNVQLLVHHTTFLPFVNGKVREFLPLCPFFRGVEESAALRRGNAPPFSLGLAQRKRPRPVKRKALSRKAGADGAFLRKTFGRRGQCGADLQARTGCAPRRRNRDSPPPHAELRLAFGVVNEWNCFSFRSPSGGVVQNRGPAGPLVWPFQGGVGETGEAPPVADEASLFRGSGAIGSPKGAGNRNAAAVLKSKRPHVSPRPKGTGLG